MSVFIPEPVFHGEPLYPSHAHRVDVRTVSAGLQVILRDRRTDEYLASGHSVAQLVGQPLMAVTHLPTGLDDQAVRAVIVSPDPAIRSVVIDWISAYAGDPLPAPGSTTVTGGPITSGGVPAEYVALINVTSKVIYPATIDGAGNWSVTVPTGDYYRIAFLGSCRDISELGTIV